MLVYFFLDSSLFYRVLFFPIDSESIVSCESDVPREVIILINLKTLLPIGRKNNELYAIRQEERIVPPDTHGIDVRNKN